MKICQRKIVNRKLSTETMSTNTDQSTKIDLSTNFPRKLTSKWKAVCRAKLPGCQQEKIKIDDVDNFSSTSWVTIIETDEDVCRKRRIHVSRPKFHFNWPNWRQRVMRIFKVRIS